MKKFDNNLKEYINATEQLHFIDYQQLIYMYLKENDLEDLVKLCAIGTLKSLGKYDINEQKLIFDEERINYSSELYCRVNGYTDKERISINKLFYLLTILHELEHVRQTKLSEKQDNDPLTLIIKEGIDLGKRLSQTITLKEKILYDFRYSLIPVERNAELSSLNKILSLEGVTIEQGIENHLIKEYNKILLKGYRNGSPLEKYYKSRNKLNDFEKFDFEKYNYDVVTKVFWGLPENLEEVKKLKRELV